MRKLTALLCTAAMTLGMAASAFANPSVSTVAPESVSVSAASAAQIPAGMTLVVQAANPANYTNAQVAEVVTMLNDATQTVTMSQMMEILQVDLTQEITTAGGTVIDPTAYEPITQFVDLAISDGAEVAYDVDGNVLSVEATITLEAVIGANAEDLMLMQMDPTTGEVYFIEIDAENFNAQTGEITVTFPCMGPFTVLETGAANAAVAE